MNYTELGEEAKELYCYMTTNPEPMKVLTRAYRMAERVTGKGRFPRAGVEISLAIWDCAKMYAKAHSDGKDFATLFPRAVRVDVRKVLEQEFKTELEAGNSWLTGVI